MFNESDKSEFGVLVMKKKKITVFVVMIIIVVIVIGVWYSTPKRFLGPVKASEVISISVFDGNTGKGFTIDDSDEIKQIIENIQSIEMKRDNFSIGYSGYSFSMEFMNENGRVIDSFIINSSNTIRDDPFFYRSDKDLCFDYLKGLEDSYVK